MADKKDFRYIDVLSINTVGDIGRLLTANFALALQEPSLLTGVPDPQIGQALEVARSAQSALVESIHSQQLEWAIGSRDQTATAPSLIFNSFNSRSNLRLMVINATGARVQKSIEGIADKLREDDAIQALVQSGWISGSLKKWLVETTQKTLESVAHKKPILIGQDSKGVEQELAIGFKLAREHIFKQGPALSSQNLLTALRTTALEIVKESIDLTETIMCGTSESKPDSWLAGDILARQNLWANATASAQKGLITPEAPEKRPLIELAIILASAREEIAHGAWPTAIHQRYIKEHNLREDQMPFDYSGTLTGVCMQVAKRMDTAIDALKERAAQQPAPLPTSHQVFYSQTLRPQ